MTDESESAEVPEDFEEELEELDDDLAVDPDEEDLLAEDLVVDELVETVVEADLEEEDEDEEAEAEEPRPARRTDEAEEDEDEEADPDDVEADLDTILRERLASADEDDDEEDDDEGGLITDFAGESNEMVCPGCFLLIRESQIGPPGNRQCPSGEEICPAIEAFDRAVPAPSSRRR
jgi:hypothetical protein